MCISSRRRWVKASKGRINSIAKVVISFFGSSRFSGERKGEATGYLNKFVAVKGDIGHISLANGKSTRERVIGAR